MELANENKILDAFTLFHRGEDQENILDPEDITLWLISMWHILFVLLVLFLHYRVIYWRRIPKIPAQLKLGTLLGCWVPYDLSV